MHLDAILVPTWLYNYWYHITAALIVPGIVPKRGIAEKPVIYFKLSTHTVLDRVKQGTRASPAISDLREPESESQTSTHLSAHCDALVLLHGSVPQQPFSFIDWSMGEYGQLLHIRHRKSNHLIMLMTISHASQPNTTSNSSFKCSLIFSLSL